MMSASDGRLCSSLDAMFARSGRWSYSDDTEMMISVAESLTRIGGVARDDLLSTLAANYDPARGYGHGMKLAIEAFKRGRPSAFASWAEGSKGSGGAVRVVALACAYHDDLDLLAALAEDTAGVTHAHALGRAGAVVHALAIAHALRATEQQPNATPVLEAIVQARLVAATTIAARLERIRELLVVSADSGAAARVLGNGVLAEEAVPFALFSFLRWAPDFAMVVRNTILGGGDTDTTSAMSGALCGALVGEDGLPAGWVERLENGPKGADYLRTLADVTFDMWRKRTAASRSATEDYGPG